MEKSLIYVPKDMIKNINKWKICEKERQGLLNNLNKFFQMKNKDMRDKQSVN